MSVLAGFGATWLVLISGELHVVGALKFMGEPIPGSRKLNVNDLRVAGCLIAQYVEFVGHTLALNDPLSRSEPVPRFVIKMR